jgi:hypothetical protein
VHAVETVEYTHVAQFGRHGTQVFDVVFKTYPELQVEDVKKSEHVAAFTSLQNAANDTDIIKLKANNLNIFIFFSFLD